jgi:hypothetical protein
MNTQKFNKNIFKIIFCTLIIFFIALPARTATVAPASGKVNLTGSLNFPGSNGSYTLGRDSQPGDVVASAATSAVSFTNVSCNLTQKTTITSGTETSSGSNIYQTGVVGIGVQFWNIDKNGNATLIPSGASGYTSTITNPGSSSTSISTKAQLVVTGPITSTGSMSGLPVIRMSFSGSCLTSNPSNFDFTVTSSASVTALSCNIVNQSIQVNLPKVNKNTFKSIGTTAGDTSFSIDLNCPSEGSNIYVAFTDVNNPSSQSDLLSLSPSSTATGIKLKISLNDGFLSPVTFGPASSEYAIINSYAVYMAPSITGNVSLPLLVQYEATSTTPSAGTVSAQAYFTISYE